MRKTVLVVCSRFPYPPIGGDKLKSYNLIKILSNDYNVHLVSLIDRKFENDDYVFCNKYCIKYKIFEKSKIEFTCR